jgi:F-type H+-transporting ATPase subunit O
LATKVLLHSTQELFKGPKTSKVMKNLMSTLAGNNRVTETDKVADAYLELMKAKRGELDAVVTSATKLTKAQMAKVTDVLKATAKGKAVSITSQVDESILGGLTLQIGDKFLDLSVKSKIDAYTKSLHSA